MNINELLGKLAQEETQFVGSEFALPIIPGQRPKVSVGGVVCTIKDIVARPRGFVGVASVRALTTSSVRFLCPVTETQKQIYLEGLPSHRLILVYEDGDWVALSLKGDTRISWGMTKVYDVEEGLEKLTRIIARRDVLGNMWYDKLDIEADPMEGDWLRHQLAGDDPTDADTLSYSGLTLEARMAYGRLREQLVQDMVVTLEQRLREQVAHLGGTYVSHVQRENTLVVTMIVNGESYIVDINADSFLVERSPICIAGQHAALDLSSMVAVIRRGQRQGLIHRIR